MISKKRLALILAVWSVCLLAAFSSAQHRSCVKDNETRAEVQARTPVLKGFLTSAIDLRFRDAKLAHNEKKSDSSLTAVSEFQVERSKIHPLAQRDCDTEWLP